MPPTFSSRSEGVRALYHPTPGFPMYLKFYGLKEPPFSFSPSPRVFFLGEEQKKALSFLTYGIRERKGFILLTREVGTGKTPFAGPFSKPWPGCPLCAHFKPQPEDGGLLHHPRPRGISGKGPFHEQGRVSLAFEKFLKACHRQQKTFLLVVDEAHEISFSLLEVRVRFIQYGGHRKKHHEHLSGRAARVEP